MNYETGTAKRLTFSSFILHPSSFILGHGLACRAVVRWSSCSVPPAFAKPARRGKPRLTEFDRVRPGLTGCDQV